MTVFANLVSCFVSRQLQIIHLFVQQPQTDLALALASEQKPARGQIALDWRVKLPRDLNDAQNDERTASNSTSIDEIKLIEQSIDGKATKTSPAKRIRSRYASKGGKEGYRSVVVVVCDRLTQRTARTAVVKN